MKENMIVPEGNIKVNAGELKRVVEITEKLLHSEEMRQADRDYLQYFEQKYVELPALRLKEQDMFNYLKRARMVAVSEKDIQTVSRLEDNYKECRGKRVKLQSELEKDKEKHGLFNELFREKAKSV